MKKRILAVCFMVCAAAWAGAADFLAEWDSLEALEKAAYDKKPSAQADLGHYYFRLGQYQQALVWFEKSAKQNDGEGLFGVGYCRETGHCGGAASLSEAMSYYKKAAAKNNPNALYRMAFLLYGGHGKAADGEKAFEYMERAAQEGNVNAREFLAEAYEAGNRSGIKRDCKKAKKWWTKLADAGDAKAMYRLADLYYTGCGVVQNLRAAFELHLEAAQAGYAPAQYRAGLAYLSGEGVQTDIAAGTGWLEKAAAQGSVPAKKKLEEIKK